MGTHTKAAFAFLDTRIAPVFDTAQRFQLVTTEDGHTVSETQEVMSDQSSPERAAFLVARGVNTLICGAISIPMREALVANDIQVVPFVAGELRQVIQAWQSGELENESYRMPGCNRQGRRQRFGTTQQEGIMPARDGKGSGKTGGRGQGQGQGQGGERGGGGRRRTPAGSAGTVADSCLCPKCGARANHEPGVPCLQKACPTCGTHMIRG